MIALVFLVALDAGAVGDSRYDPDAPTVGASIDHTEAHIGDRLTLAVSAVAKGGVAIRLPSKLDLGKLEILDRDDADRMGKDIGDGRFAHRFILGVAAYEIGEIEVPPIELSYNNTKGEVRTISTAPIPLAIRPLVAAEEKPEAQALRPPRPAIVEDRRVLKAAQVVGGGAALCVVVALLMRATRRSRPGVEVVVPSAPPRPCDQVAIEKLQALRAAGNFSAEGYRPFYFAAAEVVRAYLGARYNFDSLELTTTELLAALGERAVDLVQGDTEVTRFFRDTDLVKFAKVGSTDQASLAVLDAAQAIVLVTTPAAVIGDPNAPI